MSKRMNKLTRTAIHIGKHEAMFTCPICSLPLNVSELKSLKCPNNHTFDIARQGYLNLLTRQIQTNYNRELFEARREVIVESGLFDMFNQKITQIINDHTTSERKLTMIDMGSGEGSHLNNISNVLESQFDKTIRGIGIDISREGILEAAKSYEEMIWLVADLAKTPLTDRMCNIILNILSPSNYEEFNRVLKQDGIVIKVVPRKDYLKELREYFYKDSSEEDYSNKKVVNHFKDNFELVDQSIVQYIKSLDQSALKALVKMTPLTWNVSTEKITRFLDQGKMDITVDLDILVGKKSKVNFVQNRKYTTL